MTLAIRGRLGAGLLLLAACPGPDQLSWNTIPGTDDETGASDSTGTSDKAMTTGGDGTTTSGGPEDDDGNTFISDPGDVGVMFECSVLDRDCPRGEKCTYWSSHAGSPWNATRCVPVAPDPVGPGEPCAVEEYAMSGLDDCDAGSFCWYVDPAALTGECVPYCHGSHEDPQCDEGRKCTISSGGFLLLCVESCHPLEAPCGPGKVCVPSGADFVCAPNGSDEDGAYGDACEYVNVCSPGLFCAFAKDVPGCRGSWGCCSEYCDLSDPDFECAGADGGQACVSWYEEGQSPPGYENLGACMIAE